MGSDKSKLIEALAALAYSIAKADGDIQNSEKRLFKQIIKREFGDDAWIAEQRFDILDSAITPSIELAYKNALGTIRNNIVLFDESMSRKFMNVVVSVAESFQGMDQEESDLIDRMKVDFKKLVESQANA